ncbi:MAG: ABC transporter permease [Cyclobacteriaceae bacterium]
MTIKNEKPPKLATWLVTKFLGDKFEEEMLGDLQEIYEARVQERGRFFASLMYWLDAIHLLGGFSSRRVARSGQAIMLGNMTKVAWRNAARQKQFSVLNVIGLSLGISVSLIIALFVYNEMSYDTFHSKSDRIYRINQPLIWDDWDVQFASTGPNVAIALRQDAPEFEQVTRLLALGEQTINANTDGDKEYNLMTEDRCFAADDNFFEVFSFKFIIGNPSTALIKPNSIVVTASTAKRYFGDSDPIGKTISIKSKKGEWDSYTVTGLLEDVPSQSHIQFDMLISMSTLKPILDRDDWKWIWTAFSTYGLVKEGTDVRALEHKIQSIPPRWAPLTTERIFNQTFEEYTRGKAWALYMQPLEKIYLADQPGNHRFGPSGNPQTIKIFGVVGVLVLVLSCINFMNLSTARSSNRAKEVGIRKVMGSERASLIRQFIFESILFVLVSTLIALLITKVSLPTFNILAMKHLSFTPYLSNVWVLGGVILFVIILGTLAGVYPAWYLSAFRPIETLKGKASAGFKGKGIRNGLVVFQFTISITLIICTFFVQRQLTYVTTLDLGIEKSNVLQIHNIEQLGFDTEVLKNELKSNRAFSHVGKSFAIPPNFWDGERYRADRPENPAIDINNVRADGEYMELLGVTFLAGRNFDESRATDKYGIILNEEAVKALGWGSKETYSSDSPIGKFVVQAFDREEKLEVIGVVKNFNYRSLKQGIDPLMIIHPGNDKFWNYGLGSSFLSMRLNPNVITNTQQLQSVISDVKETIAKLDDSVPFKYSFLDEDFDKTFKSDSRVSSILNIFTGMALTIACLGLFGLAAFSAEQRTKELGIRKVLGAKTSQLVVLFSSEFARLVVIAIFIAAPLAYLLVDNWLEEFAYRTPIEPAVFVAAIFSSLIIAIATISTQSLMAASKNPVETLKEQ